MQDITGPSTKAKIIDYETQGLPEEFPILMDRPHQPTVDQIKEFYDQLPEVDKGTGG